MQDIKLIPAGENDIGRISSLASVIWNQHYPAIIGQQQVDYMLNLMYSPASLLEQMKVKKHRFYLVVFKENPVGFISMSEEKKGDWFLNKFYINQQYAATGIGTKTFQIITELIQPLTITLTVNRGNYKSVNFYFKLGFKIKEMATFNIGNGFVMDDFIMVWKKPS